MSLVLSAALSAFGKWFGGWLPAIGLYLGKSDVGSAYGAAGSLVTLLVWVYYSAQILLFGAEFTPVYANTLGSRIVPSDNAVVADPGKAKEPGALPTAGRAPGQAGDRAPVGASHAASVPLLRQSADEQPPWWFGLVVLGVSLSRFSRRWAK